MAMVRTCFIHSPFQFLWYSIASFVQRPKFPSKFLFCEEEPPCGGETPIILSHIIYDKMKEQHPMFVQKLEELGLLYNWVLTEEDDLASLVGLRWKPKYSTQNWKKISEKLTRSKLRFQTKESLVWKLSKELYLTCLVSSKGWRNVGTLDEFSSSRILGEPLINWISESMNFYWCKIICHSSF